MMAGRHKTNPAPSAAASSHARGYVAPTELGIFVGGFSTKMSRRWRYETNQEENGGTFALSFAERVNPSLVLWDVVRGSWNERHRAIRRRSLAAPSPGGEGWDEGER